MYAAANDSQFVPWPWPGRWPPIRDGDTAESERSTGSDTDRKFVAGDALPIIPGLSQSPASGVVWALGVWATVLWGDGETTWMDTSELLCWGVSGRLMMAEPAEGKQEGHVVEKDPSVRI